MPRIGSERDRVSAGQTLKVRVDDRLLHTEVLFGEFEAFQPAQFWLATNLAWRDEVDLTLVPPEIAVSMMPPAEVAERARHASSAGQASAGQGDGGDRRLVLFGTIEEADIAISQGWPVRVVTLANRGRDATCEFRLERTFFASPADIDVLLRWIDSGIDVVYQSVPVGNSQQMTKAGLLRIRDVDDE